MNNPLVSVIVPLYNVKQYLQDAIDSVLNQTYAHWELILVDDGSTDGSGDLCDGIAARDSRIRVIHAPHGGVSRARNLGLDSAGGEWIAFLDSDDTMERTALESMLREAGDADVVMGNCTGRKIQWEGRHEYKPDEMTGEDVLKFMIFSWFFLEVWGKLYRRSSLRYPFREDMELGEDTAYNLDHFYDWNRIVLIPEHVYLHQKRPLSLYTSFRVDRPQQFAYVLQIWCDVFSEDSPIYQAEELGHAYAIFRYIRDVLSQRWSKTEKLIILTTSLDGLKEFHSRLKMIKLPAEYADLWAAVCEVDFEQIYSFYYPQEK